MVLYSVEIEVILYSVDDTTFGKSTIAINIEYFDNNNEYRMAGNFCVGCLFSLFSWLTWQSRNFSTHEN